MDFWNRDGNSYNNSGGYGRNNNNGRFNNGYNGGYGNGNCRGNDRDYGNDDTNCRKEGNYGNNETPNCDRGNSTEQDATRNRRDDFEQKINDYQSKSEQEMMSELMDKAREMKNNGTFDIESLENMYKTSASFLNAAQLQKLRSLINMLK